MDFDSNLDDFRRVSEAIKLVVGSWLAKQDRLTRQLHELAVFCIQCCGEATAPMIVECFCDQYPEEANRYGEKALRDFAHNLLQREIDGLSEFFTASYNEFNLSLFQGQLPAYRLRVLHNVPDQWPVREAGLTEIDVKSAQIMIHYNGWPEDMIEWLLKLMARVSSMGNISRSSASYRQRN